MKLAFLSDIHGNAVALEAVLKDIELKCVDKIFVLGDLCFRGPEPKRSLDLIKQLNAEVIKGNADEWVVRGINKGEVPDHALEIMNKEREWTLSQLENDDLKYLGNLPLELKLHFGDTRIHAFHATPRSLFEVVVPTESDEVIIDKMMKEDADIFIYAHIHKPYIKYLNGKCIMNSGSIGLPFDGSTKSSYGLVEINDNSWQTSIVRVNYDYYKVVNQYKESTYPNFEQMTEILKRGKV